MTFPSSSAIARELDDFWKESQALQQQWQIEADIDIKMTTGQPDYWYAGSLTSSNYRNQKQLQFNKILRIINMIGGYQRDNRLATIVNAADNDKDALETAEQLSTVLSWVKRQDQTYEKISDCFEGANICGLNLLSIWMDFREDPENGEIRTTRLPFSAFYLDNYWEKQDFSDCNRVWTRKYLTRRQLLSLLPSIKNDLPLFGKGYSSKDGKFQYLAQNWYQYQQEIYAYDEYWVKDYRKKRKVLDRVTGEVIDWNGTKEQFQYWRRFNPNIDLITTSVPTIKLYVLVNSNLVYEEKSPWGLDKLPFVPFLCYHFPEVQNYAYRYMGQVRNIRDSQVELNRRRNNLLDIMTAQVQSGLMIKEDALVNPEDAFMQGPGKVLYFKQTANLATDVAPIPPPPVAQGWLELIQTIEKEIMDIVGPEELFAQNMNAKDMTSVLMKLKMGAGLVGLRGVFDKLNLSQSIAGDIILDLIQKNFSQGKIQAITGKQPTQEIKDTFFRKYHCTCDEAELTTTQRQLKFLQAVQLRQIDPNLIGSEYLLEVSTLQDKKKLIEKAAQREQQAAQQSQMQFQAEMQQANVLARSLEAKAQSDFAKAEENKANAITHIARAKQEASQAIHDRSSAVLDNAKAFKELSTMDEDRLMKMADFILEMQERQKALEGGEESDSLEKESQLASSIRQDEQESKVR